MTRRPLPAAIAGLTLLLCAGASLAQAPAPATAPAGEKQVDRKIERIRVDETGTRIDELRVGGETQTITVSPKGSMPAYEVLPATANRAPSAGERNSASGSGGTRVWKIFGF